MREHQNQSLMKNKNMNVRENQKILKKVTKFFIKLDSNLPPGWKLKEGSMIVQNETVFYCVDLPENQNKEEDIENEEESIKKVLNEFTKMEHILPPGWKMNGGSVQYGNEVICILSKEQKKEDTENRS